MNGILRLSTACGLLFLASGAAAQAQAIHVEVALGDVSLQKVPFLIAADAGLYAKNGLDVHQFITPGAARAVQANGIEVPKEYIGVSGDNAPLSITGGAFLVASVAHGKMPEPHRIVIATNENIVRDHVITRQDIHSAQELKGKTLGASFDDVTGYDGIVYLEKAGLSQDVKIGAETSLAALRDGKVDAIMANLFATALAPDQGFRDLVDVGKYHIPEAGSGVLADPQWLAANRPTAVRFLKAMVAATTLMKKDKNLFSATLAKWFNVKDPKMVDRLFLMAQDFPDRPYPAVDGIQKAMKVYDSPSLRQFKARDFYDSSLIAGLDKDGVLKK